jgi:hypothetical protein
MDEMESADLRAGATLLARKMPDNEDFVVSS